MWAASFSSNIGTWMQNVLLGAYGYTLTHSAAYVGLLYFAQLGPLLLLSVATIWSFAPLPDAYTLAHYGRVFGESSIYVKNTLVSMPVMRAALAMISTG